MDDENYALGQPVLVLVKVRNQGSVAFSDLGPLDPAMGLLSLSLERDGLKLPWTGWQTTVAFTSEGMTLLPGEAVCEIVDLLRWFGQESSMILRGGKRVRMRTLPPGHYELHLSLRARTGFVRSLPQTFVEGGTYSFVVSGDTVDLHPDSYPAETSRRGPQAVHLEPPRKKELLERGADSKGFFLMWWFMRVTESDYSARDAVLLLEARKRNPVLIAAILDNRCRTLDLPDPEKLAWIRSNQSVSVNPTLKSIFDSWRLKLEQKRYYTSH